MTSSNTYAFAPSAGDIVLNAYSMIQIRRPEITTAHLEDASMAFNFLMVDLSNRNPLRFTLETQPITLVPGTATYNLAPRTIATPTVFIRVSSGGSDIDRVIGPISASEYSSMPNKAQSGPPTSYFFSLLQAPTITLWPVPDTADTLYVQTFRQLQDVDLTSGKTLDSPYRFLDAITHGLAARLASIYNPARKMEYEVDYERKISLAQGRDQENVPLYITPGLGSYYR